MITATKFSAEVEGLALGFSTAGLGSRTITRTLKANEIGTCYMRICNIANKKGLRGLAKAKSQPSLKNGYPPRKATFTIIGIIMKNNVTELQAAFSNIAGEEANMDANVENDEEAYDWLDVDECDLTEYVVSGRNYRKR
ncbi:unnamed protein product [Allacma fusca]|uniref:Uncharacterized protein n=1 Tax=Allacma fusca TaxID=39272 RepID=A0A8J2JL55_9HEXA|nr:unnamed protein product [Allacma fusca]